MRALSASVVLSSIILGSSLARAEAQSMEADAPFALNSWPAETASDNEGLRPGVIPQPSFESPGLVTGVTFGELYTDNLTLAPPGRPKQTSWVTQVQPFLRSARSGPRFSGIFNYMLSGYVYPGKSRYNQLSQNLNALGTLTLLPQHIFLDGTASYRQEIVDNRRPAGSGAFFVNNNQANVGVGTLSPYWIQDLGKVGTMSLRYTLGRVIYNDRGIPAQDENLLSGVPDVTSNSFQFGVVSPKYETWGWNLGYSEQRLRPDFGSDVEFAMARVGVSRQVSTNTRVLVDGGKETKFLPDGTTEKLGASFWNAGVNWSNTRDSLRLLVGHRFFGPSYDLSWTHFAARLTTNVRYAERPTDYNQQLLGMNPGSIGRPPSSTRPTIPSLTERQPYLSKRLSASAVYTMPKGRLRLTLYDERRSYFNLDNSREKVANANIDWQFDVGPFTTFTPTYGWQRYQFRDGQVNYTTFAQAVLVHQFSPKNFGSVKLRHGSRNVSLGMPSANGYRVNVVFVQWTHLF